ncbi:MAG TPA: response regulator [Anaerolineales bacterium]|nr:response regulator [Anaerolineales bacterium]
MSTVLIIDDEPTARETVVSMLEGEGYDIQLAKDGIEALQMLEQIQPDVILLDIMLPGMDGFQVCRQIRATVPLAEVPILMLTALDDRDSLLRALEAGADDFLSKPVDRRELIARVRTITRLNRYRTLMEQRENIRQMAERVVAAQEEERQRISRELHDDLGQALTTHLLSLRNLQEDLSIPVEEMFAQLQALYNQSYEVLVKIRRLARDLRPPVLDALGLKVAMQTYCTEFTRRTHLPVIFEAETSLPELSDAYNITLYRTLQEALTNVVKHARAGQVWVELSQEDDTVNLTVQDNGIGMDEEASRSNGIGLAGLRERITVAGGTLQISSAPGRGTILSAQFPFLESRH